MAKKYVIKVDLDLTKAKQQAEQLGNMLAKAEARAASGMAGAERARSRARQREVDAEAKKQSQIEMIALRAQVRDEARRRGYQQRQTEQAKKQAEKEAAAAETAATKALLRDDARRRSHQQKQAEQEKKKNDRLAEQEKRRIERDAAAAEAAATKVLLKDEQRRRNHQQKQADSDRRRAERDATSLERIQDNLYRRDYRNRVRYEAMKEREAKKAAEAAAKAQKEYADESLANSTTAAKQATAAGVGFALASAKVVLDAFREIESRASEAADRLIDLKKQLREEAGIVGAPMVTDQMVLESLKFRAATGLGDRESTDFRRQYLGSVNIGRQKFDLSGGKEGVSQGVADELMVAAGARAARIGGDAGTAGELSGLIAQFGPVKSVEEGMGQLEAIRMALTEGRGDDTPLTRELLQASGALVGEGGAVPTLPEMAALIGTTSLATGPQGAATRAEQAVRGMRFGLLKQRKISGADQSQADYLKGIGVTADSTFEQSLDKVYEDVAKNSSVEQADIYLGKQGFRNVEEVRAIQQLLKNYAVFKSRMDKSRKPGQGRAAMDANKEFLTNTPEGRMAVADAAKMAADSATGVKTAGLEAGIKEAEASPEMDAEDRSMGGYFKDMLRGAMEFSGPATGKRRRLQRHAMDQIQKKAKDAGMTPDEMSQAYSRAMSQAGGNYRLADPYMYKELESYLSAKGVSSGADPSASLGMLEQAIRENTAAINRAKGGVVPPPIRVPAAQGNLNP